jgi:hypothetical protein
LKPSFSANIKPKDNLLEHVQSLTDDVTDIIRGKLSYDTNLPSRIFTTLCNSGEFIPMPFRGTSKALGVMVVLVENNKVITKQQYLNESNNISIALTFEDNLASRVTFFVIYGV